MTKRGRPRKAGARYPGGRLKQEIWPTMEMTMRRIEATGSAMVGIDHPLDVMHAKGALARPAVRHPVSGEDVPEDPQEASRRRDAGASFANLANHLWGQPFASIDARTRRFVPPNINAEDADALAEKEARARQTDTRTPEERAEAVRRRFDAMLSLVGRGTIREWVLRQVTVFCVPLQQLARSPSKREQLRLQLLDALDAIGDEAAVRRAVDGMRRAA